MVLEVKVYSTRSKGQVYSLFNSDKFRAAARGPITMVFPYIEKYIRSDVIFLISKAALSYVSDRKWKTLLAIYPELRYEVQDFSQQICFMEKYSVFRQMLRLGEAVVVHEIEKS